jgi:hypothetical protein
MKTNIAYRDSRASVDWRSRRLGKGGEARHRCSGPVMDEEVEEVAGVMEVATMVQRSSYLISLLSGMHGGGLSLLIPSRITIAMVQIFCSSDHP